MDSHSFFRTNSLSSSSQHTTSLALQIHNDARLGPKDVRRDFHRSTTTTAQPEKVQNFSPLKMPYVMEQSKNSRVVSSSYEWGRLTGNMDRAHNSRRIGNLGIRHIVGNTLQIVTRSMHKDQEKIRSFFSTIVVFPQRKKTTSQ